MRTQMARLAALCASNFADPRYERAAGSRIKRFGLAGRRRYSCTHSDNAYGDVHDERSTVQTMREQQEKRPSIRSRQRLKIKQLRCDGSVPSCVACLRKFIYGGHWYPYRGLNDERCHQRIDRNYPPTGASPVRRMARLCPKNCSFPNRSDRQYRR